MSRLIFRAGKKAFENIRKKGFCPEDVKGVVAAAGGPKWFTTYGLVRYIISDLISSADHEIHFLGSSVGSWQMCAALTSDPQKAIDQLQDSYCNYLYSEKPDAEEISSACANIIRSMLGDDLVHIINHPLRHLHVMTARGKGWLGHSNKITRGAGFAFSFFSNALRREFLQHSTERVVFSNSDALPYDIEDDILPTTIINLTVDNILMALRASGTIPFMMADLQDVPGGPKGSYMDGGITDYHISLPYNLDGIIIHPHFLPYVLEGWFDKKLPWTRRAREHYMSNVLLITPSKKFVDSLPRRQISDLKDLKYFGLNQRARIEYWDEISKRSLELGEEMKQVIESGDLAKVVRPYSIE